MASNKKNTLTPDITMGEVYEGGALNTISIDELLGNKVAIRQLVNEVNAKNRQIEKIADEKLSLERENAALKNQSQLRWYDALFNAIGAIVLAIGTNILSSNKVSAILLILVGIACIAIVNIIGIVRANQKDK